MPSAGRVRRGPSERVARPFRGLGKSGWSPAERAARRGCRLIVGGHVGLIRSEPEVVVESGLVEEPHLSRFRDPTGGDAQVARPQLVPDGRLDVLVSNNGAPPLLLRNRAGEPNHWLGLHLVGTRCNRDAIGARITWSAGSGVRSRIKSSGGSYLSSHDPREILGLGAVGAIDWVEIRWPDPDGGTERFTALPADRYINIVQKS